MSRLCWGAFQFVTASTVRLCGRNSQIRIVARETGGVTIGDCLECALLKPKRIVQILWRWGYVFFVRLSLWLVSLMTDGAILRCFFLLPANVDESCFAVNLRPVKTNDIEMFVVREADLKLGYRLALLMLRGRDIAKTGKQIPCSVARRYFDMAVGANNGSRPFTREELLPMTIETTRVLRKIRDVRNRRLSFADFLPIL